MVTPDDAVGHGHIPSSLLARWDRVAPTLTGELRALIQGHLERCDDCRRELETLGFDPALIARPRLEGVARTPRPVARARWTPWHTAAVGVVASAAGLLVVFQAGLVPIGPRPPAPMPGPVASRPQPAPPAGTPVAPAPPTETAPSPAPAPQPLIALGPPRADAVRLSDALRGAGVPDSIPSGALGPDGIAITPPPSLAFADGARVRVEIVNDRGTVVRTLHTTVSALFPGGSPRVIVVRQGSPPLAPGHYQLRIITRGAGGAASELAETHGFDIRP